MMLKWIEICRNCSYFDLVGYYSTPDGCCTLRKHEIYKKCPLLIENFGGIKKFKKIKHYCN